MSVFLPYSNGQRLWVGTTGWVAGPLDPMRYIEFNASPQPGNSLTVTNVSFNYGDFPLSINFNILNFQAYYSTDNWVNSTVLNTTALVYLNTTMSLFAQSIVPGVLVPSGQIFSLRIYIYALQNGIAMTPTFAIHNNVVICGTTAPEVLDNGSICGVKYNDLNGNGVWDAGEPRLPNWTINLTGASTLSVTTDEKGKYCFNNLPAGTYTVSEVMQTDWQQTEPASGTYTITLAAGQNIGNRNFGNTCNKAWTALGSGVNGNVLALAVMGGKLYDGGNFTTAGGVSANRVAKWGCP